MQYIVTITEKLQYRVCLSLKGNIMQVRLYYAFSNHAFHCIFKHSVKQKRHDNNDMMMMMMMKTKNCRLSYLLNKYPPI